MRLREYSFRPDYNKDDCDIAADFYLPAMRNSCLYDRISGYFGSTIYIIAWSALLEFVNQGGRIRLICSPCISDADRDAIAEGYAAISNEKIKESLSREMEELFALDYLDKPARILACLVSEGILEIKIAIPRRNAEPDIQRLFHDKVGIFTDENGDSVGFRGSMNETFQGLSDSGNIESIDVFPSWVERRDAERLANAARYFESLWNKTAENVIVFDFPDAIRRNLIDKGNGYDWRTLAKEISTTISLSKKWSPNKKKDSKTPRDHQIEALENWVRYGRRGILEHATGSGKTFTAICAIRDALDRGKSVLIGGLKMTPRQNLSDLLKVLEEIRSTEFLDVPSDLIERIALIQYDNQDDRIWKSTSYYVIYSDIFL